MLGLYQGSGKVAGAEDAMSRPASAFSVTAEAASGLGRMMVGCRYLYREGSEVVGKSRCLIELK